MTGWLRHPRFGPALLLAALWLGSGLMALLIVGPNLGGSVPALLTTCFAWDAATRAYRLETVLLALLEPPLFALVVWFAYADEVRRFLAGRTGRAAALASSGAFAASAAALVLSGQVGASAPAAAGARAPLRDGRPAPTAALTDQHGRPFSVADAAGRPLALTFVYTNCHATCPTVVTTLRGVEAATPPAALFVAITLDPERDTPEVLRGYAERWRLGPSWRLLTGRRGDVEPLLAAYGIRVRRLATGEIDHDSAIVLVDRLGRIAYTYRGRPPAAGDLARTLARLAEEPA